MAQIKTEGLDELMLSMKEAAELPDDVAEEMLQAAAGPVARTQKRNYQTAFSNHPDFETGKVARSIKISRMKRKRSGDERYVTIYPQGTHHTYANGKKATNAEVAFVHEYGADKKGIAAKQIMRKSVEQSADEAIAAEFDVYDRFLSQHNL